MYLLWKFLDFFFFFLHTIFCFNCALVFKSVPFGHFIFGLLDGLLGVVIEDMREFKS